MTYAQVVVNVPSVAGVFDYALPEGFHAAIGQLVTIPFSNQTVQGVILRFIEQPAVPNPRTLISALDPEPVLSQTQIALAESLAESNLLSLAAVVEMMLPPGLGKRADTRFELRQREIESPGTQFSAVGSRLVKVLQERGPLRARQIDRYFGPLEWRGEARKLVRQGVLDARPILPTTSLRPKVIRTAQLGVAPEIAEASMPELGQREATLKRRQAALRYLMRLPAAVNVAWVYAESGCNAADLQELAERDLVVLRESEIWRDPLEKIDYSQGARLELTTDQKAAWLCIQGAFQEVSEGITIQPFLLQGVTGSGKTELYLRAVEEAVGRGRHSIVLVPEIALTPQIVRRFLERFPGQVGLIHSRLSEGERYDTWRRARLGLLKVVIGPRSALFAPLPNIGLIVVDECHDGSYYQSEPPFYHAVSAAQTYARLAGAVCILGSATPSIVQRHESENGKSRRLELPRRIAEPGLPPVSVVDMRAELKDGNRSIFSRELIDSLEATLQKKEQAILFLNRRGTATYVFCRV